MTSSSSTIHPTPAPHRRRRRRPRRLVSSMRLQVCLDETTETWTPRTNHTCFHEEARELYERFSSLITDVRHTRDARDAHESRARMRMWISSRLGRNASPNSLHSHSHSSDARRIDTSLSMSDGCQLCFVLLIYRAATTTLTTDADACRVHSGRGEGDSFDETLGSRDVQVQGNFTSRVHGDSRRFNRECRVRDVANCTRDVDGVCNCAQRMEVCETRRRETTRREETDEYGAISCTGIFVSPMNSLRLKVEVTETTMQMSISSLRWRGGAVRMRFGRVGDTRARIRSCRVSWSITVSHSLVHLRARWMP